MKLLLDVGNTSIKWAYDDGESESLVESGEVRHRSSTPEAAAQLVAQLAVAPTAAYAVNVAGSKLAAELVASLADRFGVNLQFIATSARFGDLVNGYRAVEQLGADRWAAIVGAWQRYQRAVCVIDAGTALTVDVVNGQGQHQGGIIVPGLHLMRASLNLETSDISGFASKRVKDAGPDWYGLDTGSAVEKGTLFMLRATINAAITESGVGDVRPAVVLTGGDAGLLAPLLAYPGELRPLLVLEGLRCLAAGAADA